jgi:hypothetical protein
MQTLDTLEFPRKFAGFLIVIEMWITAFNIYHKYGAILRKPSHLKQKLERFYGTSCLAIYRPSFAAGLLSCYTDLGQPRHIELYEGNFYHQVD